MGQKVQCEFRRPCIPTRMLQVEGSVKISMPGQAKAKSSSYLCKERFYLALFPYLNTSIFFLSRLFPLLSVTQNMSSLDGEQLARAITSASKSILRNLITALYANDKICYRARQIISKIFIYE